MKTFKQILFTIVAVAGLSLAVSAQKGEKPPPKDPPPTIPVKPKPTPPDRPKKPGMAYFVVTVVKEKEYTS